MRCCQQSAQLGVKCLLEPGAQSGSRLCGLGAGSGHGCSSVILPCRLQHSKHNASVSRSVWCRVGNTSMSQGARPTPCRVLELAHLATLPSSCIRLQLPIVAPVQRSTSAAHTGATPCHNLKVGRPIHSIPCFAALLIPAGVPEWH